MDETAVHFEDAREQTVEVRGGLTAYLQGGDIGIYKQFKDILDSYIDEWKGSDTVEYTRARKRSRRALVSCVSRCERPGRTLIKKLLTAL
ncbi:hypothetical protein PInf_019459 [Phytophthora infestans]|nr:hypothetical protein PInf_019459 [Phytophthora infestans]